MEVEIKENNITKIDNIVQVDIDIKPVQIEKKDESNEINTQPMEEEPPLIKKRYYN